MKCNKLVNIYEKICKKNHEQSKKKTDKIWNFVFFTIKFKNQICCKRKLKLEKLKTETKINVRRVRGVVYIRIFYNIFSF